MSSVDICLISPPQRAFNHHRPPLALMFIASFLEKNDIKTEIIDPKSNQDVSGKQKDIIINKILQQVDDFNPPVIGISCYTPEFNDVIGLAKKIKETVNDKIEIIVGGVHSTLRPEDFFYKNSPVDFAVIGEGEITLYELTYAITKSNKDYKNIKGIAYISKDKYVQTDPRPLIDNLDEMPFPAFEKVDMEYYTSPNPYAIRGMFFSSFYILVGRGCPSKCTFCVSAEMRKILAPGKSLRCRSANNVVDEIELLKNRYKIDSFYFIDDNFTLRKDLVSGFCDEIIRRKLNLIWGCSARINTLSEELISKMKKAGCMQVDIGVESGADAVLKRLKKNITAKQIKEIFRACHNIGMRVFANVLMNVPEETEEEVNDTLRLLDKIRPSVTSFNIFIPYLGTEIYNDSQIDFSPKEYSLLGEPPRKLVLDPRFRFAKHSLDFDKLYTKNHKKYNSALNFLPYYFSFFYLSHIIRSKRKKDYFFKLKDLIKEYLKQIRQ